MSENAVLLFPHHLFEKHPCISNKNDIILLVEHPRYFSDFSFHKQKLILHRASMKAYQIMLEKKGFKTLYIDHSKSSELFSIAKKNQITHFNSADFIDNPFKEQFAKECKKHNLTLAIYSSPMFLTPLDFLEKELGTKNRFFMASFYIAQRKRMNILVKSGKPVGGKWSFDTLNRKPLSKNHVLPKVTIPRKNDYVKEAIQYIETFFSKNPGSINDFWFPITHHQAKIWFLEFLKKRLHLFGTHEDAIKKHESIIYHSVLSPLLNNGLLTPDYVVNRTLEYAQKNSISINNLEGFIRQIIGWREFVRGVYLYTGEKQRKSNFFNHVNKLPSSFWNSTTGVEPIDNCIKKAINHAYCHRIERLMILGNFMLLLAIDPNEVYKWFMEFFIDAYDWVMVPNVYGMSQYADGGLMTTKPYFSGSNYIKKMSDFKKGDWSALWDSLYWYFIYKNRLIIASNSRLKIMTIYLKKMNHIKLKEHIYNAETFVKKFTKNAH